MRFIGRGQGAENCAFSSCLCSAAGFPFLSYPFRCALPPLRRPPQLTMYSTAGMKFSRRWRRMAWRLNTTTFGAFVVSTLVSLAAVRAMVSSAGPKDSRASPTQTPAAASRALLARGRARALAEGGSCA